MAVTVTFYNPFFTRQFNGNAIDFDTDTIKVALLTGHTPDTDAHDFFNDVSANEVSGTNYPSGGWTVAVSVSEDDTDNEAEITITDETNSTVTVSATHAVLYKDTGNAATSPLICIIDFGGTVTATAGDFTFNFAAPTFTVKQGA
jgi:hypothetical protein